MGDKTQGVVEQALKLSPDERAEVAERLLASLDEAPDIGVEQAWQAEVQRRLEEIEWGEVKMIPWEEVQRRLQHGT